MDEYIYNIILSIFLGLFIPFFINIILTNNTLYPFYLILYYFK